jgi:hypothetical protein
MKKINLIVAMLFAYASILVSQVPKKVIVEHFTNTRCGVCAARNPGFYTNLNAQSGVIHLAVHPSSPYSTCFLSQHNPSENDGRTNYYGVFGGTPRIVIQGSVIPSAANYGAAALFTPFLAQTSPASIKIQQTKFDVDSIRSTIVVKTMSTHTLTNLKLFVALAEDTVFYTAPNGEPKHFNVFRKSYTGTSGIAITLPANVGDSVVYSASSTVNSAWIFSRITTLAILQDGTTNEVVQSEKEGASYALVTGIKNQYASANQISVNVVHGFEKSLLVSQTQELKPMTFLLVDLLGRNTVSKSIENRQEYISVSSLPKGIYAYKIESNHEIIKTGKLFID